MFLPTLLLYTPAPLYVDSRGMLSASRPKYSLHIPMLIEEKVRPPPTQQLKTLIEMGAGILIRIKESLILLRTTEHVTHDCMLSLPY